MVLISYLDFLKIALKGADSDETHLLRWCVILVLSFLNPFLLQNICHQQPFG